MSDQKPARADVNALATIHMTFGRHRRALDHGTKRVETVGLSREIARFLGHCRGHLLRGIAT